MKKAILKKIVFCLFIVPSIMLIVFLSSCNPSLGKFDKEEGGFEDYYNSIGDIIGKYEAPKDDDQTQTEFKSVTYDLEDSITNEYIMEYLKWKDDTKKVDFRQYVYIVIPFTSDLKIEELALYVCTNASYDKNANRTLEISAFYYPSESDCPEDGDLLKMSDGEKAYTDPPNYYSIAKASINVTSSFDSFVLSGFHQTVGYGESYVVDSMLSVKKDSYLYLRIENNSALNKGTMTPIDISFINLLVRAV